MDNLCISFLFFIACLKVFLLRDEQKSSWQSIEMIILFGIEEVGH